MKRQLLIVDGYNMIGAWPELTALKNQERLEEAREALLFRLSNYAKYQGLETIVVFTKEDETADSYIERIAGELNDRLTQVTVATSDLAEQWTIFSQGALRTSARELYKSVQQTEAVITGDTKDTHFKNFRRNSPWNNEQLQKLSQKLDELSKKK